MVVDFFEYIWPYFWLIFFPILLFSIEFIIAWSYICATYLKIELNRNVLIANELFTPVNQLPDELVVVFIYFNRYSHTHQTYTPFNIKFSKLAYKISIKFWAFIKPFHRLLQTVRAINLHNSYSELEIYLRIHYFTHNFFVGVCKRAYRCMYFTCIFVYFLFIDVCARMCPNSILPIMRNLLLWI